MLIYSQWRPEGGYNYFETNQNAPLGDDLPIPNLQVVNGIGAPSVESGRPIPAGARYTGSGVLAVGVVAPMDTSHLGVTLSMSSDFWMGAFVGIVAATGAVVGYRMMRARSR